MGELRKKVAVVTCDIYVTEEEAKRIRELSNSNTAIFPVIDILARLADGRDDWRAPSVYVSDPTWEFSIKENDE